MFYKVFCFVLFPTELVCRGNQDLLCSILPTYKYGCLVGKGKNVAFQIDFFLSNCPNSQLRALIIFCHVKISVQTWGKLDGDWAKSQDRIRLLLNCLWGNLLAAVLSARSQEERQVRKFFYLDNVCSSL